MLSHPHASPEGQFFSWYPDCWLFLPALPWLSCKKTGQAVPGCKALPCLCTFCWVGGAGSGPGSAAWRAGSEPRHPQDRGKRLPARGVGAGDHQTAQVWEGDVAKVTWLGGSRTNTQNHRTRRTSAAGGQSKRFLLSPKSRATQVHIRVV